MRICGGGMAIPRLESLKWDADGAGMRRARALLKLAQRRELLGLRRRQGLDVRRDLQRPAGRPARRFRRDSRVETGQLELLTLGVRPQHAEVGDHRARTCAGRTARGALAAAAEIAARGAE